MGEIKGVHGMGEIKDEYVDIKDEHRIGKSKSEHGEIKDVHGKSKGEHGEIKDGHRICEIKHVHKIEDMYKTGALGNKSEEDTRIENNKISKGVHIKKEILDKSLDNRVHRKVRVVFNTDTLITIPLSIKMTKDGKFINPLEDEKVKKAVENQLKHIKEYGDIPLKNEDESIFYVHKDVDKPEILNGVLKDYQLKGLNWLINLYNQGINGILADDMGLGKTIQAISLLAYIYESYNIKGPFLIVTPASTLHNWENEIKRFVPIFTYISYYGNISERKESRKKIKKSNIVITSYQIAVSDSYLMKNKWQYMILDEAQAIKSINSLRWKTLLNFKSRNRLLLTGTPIQNTMQELWSLLHFIMPTLFDNLSEFSEWFCKDIESKTIGTQSVSIKNDNKSILVDGVNRLCNDFDDEDINLIMMRKMMQFKMIKILRVCNLRKVLKAFILIILMIVKMIITMIPKIILTMIPKKMITTALFKAITKILSKNISTMIPKIIITMVLSRIIILRK